MIDDSISEKSPNYTREMLVEEYLETRLATFVEICGVDHRWMPKDVSKDAAYWKTKDKDIHDMHIEIARRYNIKRDDCLWLENIVDRDNLYVMEYRFKPLVEHSIKELERLEYEKKREKRDKNKNVADKS